MIILILATFGIICFLGKKFHRIWIRVLSILKIFGLA